METDRILLGVRGEVEKRLRDQGAGHGFDHVLRVLRLSEQIREKEGGDPFIVALAVLLHDVGDAKFHGGIECSGEFAEEILTGLAVDEEVIRHVVHIVDNLSFRKHRTAEPLSLEGQVVQDADRLDALGAIGIVRTIEYGASKGQPFFVPGTDSAKSGVGHFYEKLFKLRGMMNTQTAIQLALQREQFMQTFLDQFYAEWGEV